MGLPPKDDDTSEILSFLSPAGDTGQPFWTIYRLACLFLYREPRGLTGYTDFNEYIRWAEDNPRLCLMERDGKTLRIK